MSIGAPAATLAELAWLRRLIDNAPPQAAVRTVCEVDVDGTVLPVHVITLGNPDPAMPAVGFFGGVHGLEIIGTQVLLRFVEDLFARLRTDAALARSLETLRLVIMPLVNPGGMLRATRANPRGVDLMRNAPVDSTSRVPFMLGGQRFSSRLPWYRGASGQAMETESRALCDVVEQELLGRAFAVALDCHSGFGFRDRIWFPYAHSPSPMLHLPEIHALAARFAAGNPRHTYLFEPQSRQYLTHGDLWDFLYQRSLERDTGAFLPLTLEMGSWRWIRKQPRQLFSRLGMFNPLSAERRERVLKQHMPWLQFLTSMGGNWMDWMPSGAQRTGHHQAALTRWYR